MADVICPLCGKPNPPDLVECQYCQAPLKSNGFLAPSEGEEGIHLEPPGSKGAVESEKTSEGFKSGSSLEDAVPDWLKDTEATFLEPNAPKTEEPASDEFFFQPAALTAPPVTPSKKPEDEIDEDWLAGLLAEAGAVESTPVASTSEPPANLEAGTPSQDIGTDYEVVPEEGLAQPTLPIEKPDWLTSLEASSKIKLDGGIFASETEQAQPEPLEPANESEPAPVEQPEWLTKASSVGPMESPPEIPIEKPAETPPETHAEPPVEEVASIAPAEIPGWLEALRPAESIAPTGPVEDVSAADVVTAGPLSGLRGVIASQPSIIRPQKPPTYSIKLKVTEEQQERLKMMEELLADEEKPKPTSAKHVITTRNIFRLLVAAILLLPILWMIISNSRKTTTPQPGNIPGVTEFAQQIQSLPQNAPVLMAFDYEAGYSGELNVAVSNVVTQLIKRNIYITLVSTTSSGPALAESIVHAASINVAGTAGAYTNYTDLGFLPGGTLGLLGLAASPRSILPYALDEKNVWAVAPLNSVASVSDFAAVIVITNDPDTARIWIEQIGTKLQDRGTPLLMLTSSQAEPLIRPYYEANQVKGLIAGLTGGVAYARTVGNYAQNGTWDALSAGVTVSILVILVGSIAGVAVKMLGANKREA